ncbi:MAG: 2-dehydropantoate 2-reductase [Proteobacteria bacterium]|nr:2-dehydropantoate 2-reductase [Pseudomonadota bacterium]
MFDDPIRLAVIGAGAVGGTVAGLLKLAGRDPVVVARHQAVADRLASPGLHLSGKVQDPNVRLHAVRSLEDLTGPLDLVFLATKATDCAAAARELPPRLHDDSLVVSLQNGMVETELAEILGPRRVVACVVRLSAERLGPAEIEVTDVTEMVIGSLDGPDREALETVRTVLDPAVPTRISDNIKGELFAKLIDNCCVNPTTAVTGWTVGRLLSEPRGRSSYLRIMAEAMGVAQAMGVRVEPGAGGRLDYAAFLADSSPEAEAFRHQVLEATAPAFIRTRPSMLQDLEHGRRTEIDYLNGYVVDRGREHGRPTPLNAALADMVREIGAGRREMGPENLDDPARPGF